MKLSIVVVCFDMHRELPRTLHSLSSTYQIDARSLDYEVVVVDNGSTRPPDRAMVESFGPQFRLLRINPAPGSPARAINAGVDASSGELVCVMIDGAHILTPGVFGLALAAFRAFPDAVVATRYFYLGPGPQNETVLAGYDQTAEDALLERVDWRMDGYRLFEIGTPLQFPAPKITWFNKMLESNCLFMRRSVFVAMGGADERFDLPGGGFLNLDLYCEALAVEGTVPVLLVGEGSFHQVHGGTTTNVDTAARDSKVAIYRAQYETIRGKPLSVSEKDVFYLGHMPTQHSKIHLRNR